MIYKLKFHKKALKEWKKLDSSIKDQFKNKLEQRIVTPRVPKDKLSGFENIYKIKLKNIGYRLAYEVMDQEITIIVLVVNSRENNKIYNLLKKRF